MTPSTIVAVVLAAAVLHASWNALVHAISDRFVGFAWIGVVYLICGGAAALAAGLPQRQVWPYVLASAALHVVYNLLLWASYRLGEFSQVYPLARGIAPLTVTVVAVTLLRQTLPPNQLVGIVLISLGLIALMLVGGVPGRAQRLPLLAAVGTGLMIASYTVVDGVGVRLGPLLPYIGWMFFLQGCGIVVIAAARYPRTILVRLRPHTRRGLLGGLISLVAYCLVLWAQTSGALAPIAALRESSIVFGAIIGAVFLGERLGLRRALAAIVVLGGIVLLSTSV